ncbi:MAG: GIY-YIG nuclease family protein [Proteobacteria bacterium]|nr:GIY-YIG nuclease family protein [Pseudomonadota bacterium]
MHWFVYIIETQSGKFYTGICKDINKRFEQHSGLKKGGAKFFRSDPPALLVFEESHKSQSHALKREYEIKSMSRAQKEALISI